MFGLFKKKSKVEKLQEEYQKLKEKAFALSKTDRSASDKMTAKAEEILEEIDKLKKNA
jgi:NADP-dependent 3-hydroxy acid dehydrogenase YdfG